MKTPAVMSLILFFPVALAAVVHELVLMTPLEMFGWAFAVSAFGGMASSMREKPTEPLAILRVGFNTAIMGCCLSMVGYKWTSEDPSAAWLVIGVCGILSMGGVASINWVLDRLKNKIGKTLDNKQEDDET
tara:strand:+ start:739 stop:1131 length:393 start_codon:yes stop_codon:yes gene_type:complete